MVLLRGMDDPDIALGKGKRLCAKLSAASVTDAAIPLSCSVGVTSARQNEIFSDVFCRADTALYQAKRKEKGGCCLWEAGTETEEAGTRI